jgi:hypothetical protein
MPGILHIEDAARSRSLPHTLQCANSAKIQLSSERQSGMISFVVSFLLPSPAALALGVPPLQNFAL